LKQLPSWLEPNGSRIQSFPATTQEIHTELDVRFKSVYRILRGWPKGTASGIDGLARTKEDDLLVSGNPVELRAAAAKARGAQQSLDSDLRAVESIYNSLRFDVPNKGKIDDLLRDARQKLNTAKDGLADLEKRLNSVAQQLESINRG
jgi:hypothetical protein